MTDRCSIEIRSDGSARLCGALTFETVPGLFREAAAHIADAADGQLIDLADVQAVDSAGLALLLEWQASRKASGMHLTFVNAPASLVSLVSLAEATRLLNLSDRRPQP
jgi:ABC-type transporter Mla MlaB component